MKACAPLQQEITICGDDRMQEAGRAIASQVMQAQLSRSRDQCALITLRGDLGAGKTTLVKGLVNGLLGNPVPPVSVTSPTFTLVEQYDFVGGTVYHIDLYRLETAEELEPLGLRDMLHPGNLIIIEWPERASRLLPPADFDIGIRFADGVSDAAACRVVSGPAELMQHFANQHAA